MVEQHPCRFDALLLEDIFPLLLCLRCRWLIRWILHLTRWHHKMTPARSAAMQQEETADVVVVVEESLDLVAFPAQA